MVYVLLELNALCLPCNSFAVCTLCWTLSIIKTNLCNLGVSLDLFGIIIVVCIINIHWFITIIPYEENGYRDTIHVHSHWFPNTMKKKNWNLRHTLRSLVMWIMSRKISINRMNKSMLLGWLEYGVPCHRVNCDNIQLHRSVIISKVSSMFQPPFIHISIVFTSLQWIGSAVELTRKLPSWEIRKRNIQYKYWVREHYVSAIRIPYRK